MCVDSVNHPYHYNQYGIEVIELVRKLNFDSGNCSKYILRSPFKGNTYKDLSKSLWYANDLVFNGKPSSRIFLKKKAYSKLYNKATYFEQVILSLNIPCAKLFAELLKASFHASIDGKDSPFKSFKDAILNLHSVVIDIENNEEWKAYVKENEYEPCVGVCDDVNADEDEKDE